MSMSIQPLVTTGQVVQMSKSDEKLYADYLNLAKMNLSSGTYKYRKVIADNNIGTSPTLQLNGITDVNFTIPANTIFNPAKCKFRGRLTAGVEAGRFVMFYINTPFLFNVLEVYDDLGNYFQRSAYHNKIAHIVLPWKTSMEEFLHKSPLRSGSGGQVQPNFQCVWSGTPFSTINASINNIRPQKTPVGEAGYKYCGKRGFITQQYLLVGNAAGVADPVIDFCFVMSEISPNSFWSLNKDVFFGPTRVTRIHVGLEQAIKYGFSTAAQNQCQNVVGPQGNPPVTSANALTVVPTLSNFEFELAVESDLNIIAMITKAFAEKGLSYDVPFTKVIRPSLLGQQQTAQVQISRADGISLKEIYASCYNINERADTMYGNSQIIGVVGVENPDTYGNLLTSYHTEWNSIQIQPLELILANMDDYRYNLDFIKGSMIDSIDTYYHNWSHVEVFNNMGPLHIKHFSAVPVENINGGFSLADGSLQLYNVVGQARNAAVAPVPGTGAFNPQTSGLIWYIVVTTVKELKVNLATVYFA